MSWGDALKGVVGSLAGQLGQGAFGGIVKQVLGEDGLKVILDKLEGAGLGAIVASWLDKTKESLPISADQLKSALGEEHVQEMAKKLGIPLDTVLAALSAFLPDAAAKFAETSGGRDA